MNSSPRSWEQNALLALLGGLSSGPLLPNQMTKAGTETACEHSHADAIGLQVVNCTTAIFPADRGDCNHDPGAPAEGQWFRFASSVGVIRGWAG
jgi:hypothetical protein